MNIKQIKSTIAEGQSLKVISQAYTEIASNKLKRIRAAVERNRFYMEDLSSVYQVVKQVASVRNLLPKKNNKTISILITSNYHFYGNVNNNLIKFFVQQMNNHPTEQIVIGKTAFEYLNGINYQPVHQKLLLKTDYPTPEELTKLVTLIKPYSQIIVFYAQLKTVMVQIPVAKDITQTAYLKPVQLQEKEKPKAFIFEPELEKILDFFESQVTNLLLEQAFLESELSRTASRLISMDQAQSSADKYLKEQKILLGQAKKSISNAKLIETYTSIEALLKTSYDNS